MHPILSTILLVASLTPSKMWFAPDQPLMVEVKPGGEATLVLTDFAGKILAPTGNADVAEDKALNVKEAFQQLEVPGTYVLYLTKRGAAKELSYAPAEFIGTPLVINVRQDLRPGAEPKPIVARVEPLRYVVMTTAHGPMTMIFYYDVAPNTVRHFQTLAGEGFYDGLKFHRIVPGFVIQGGDPLGNSRGGPGFTVPAEFSRRKHTEGVLSMARSGDPLEAQGAPPRKEFADSAGSQFFICLDYAGTKQLDEKYTAFGEVAAGMDAAKKIAAVPLLDARAGQPKENQVIEKVEVKPVTAAENPYGKLFQPVKADAPAAGK
jgi:peptidyl-prolyl cis-trans isomerase B (cyclophilin B)